VVAYIGLSEFRTGGVKVLRLKWEGKMEKNING
jgi:hypothetical protein